MMEQTKALNALEVRRALVTVELDNKFVFGCSWRYLDGYLNGRWSGQGLEKAKY